MKRRGKGHFACLLLYPRVEAGSSLCPCRRWWDVPGQGTRGCALCRHVLILPAAFTAGWCALLVPGVMRGDRNLCCETAQALQEAKFAETRPRRPLCRPQSWAAHPADRTGRVLQKGDGGRDPLGRTATVSLRRNAAPRYP